LSNDRVPFSDLSKLSQARRDEIAAAAKELDRLRNNWLNPPEWTRVEILEFPYQFTALFVVSRVSRGSGRGGRRVHGPVCGRCG
jgi:hypothetical protein